MRVHYQCCLKERQPVNNREIFLPRAEGLPALVTKINKIILRGFFEV